MTPKAPGLPVNSTLRVRTAEWFVTTMMRLWVERPGGSPGRTVGWRDGIDAAGLDGGAAASFDALMLIVSVAARQPLDVRPPGTSVLGADEALLLALVGALQGGRYARARAIVDDWLAPAAARHALPRAAGFADALAASGLRVNLSCAEDDAVAPTVVISADRGIALMH